jgi:hypothetical protein
VLESGNLAVIGNFLLHGLQHRTVHRRGRSHERRLVSWPHQAREDGQYPRSAAVPVAAFCPLSDPLIDRPGVPLGDAASPHQEEAAGRPCRGCRAGSRCDADSVDAALPRRGETGASQPIALVRAHRDLQPPPSARRAIRGLVRCFPRQFRIGVIHRGRPTRRGIRPTP